MRAAQVAGDVGEWFVPGVGWAMYVANSAIASDIQRHQREQSSRVSLFLMQDAGYDIYQAPLAWWRLGSKDKLANKLTNHMPQHAVYVYKALGESWRATPNSLSSGKQATGN